MAKKSQPPPDNPRPLTRDELQLWDAFTRQDERLAHADIDWDGVMDSLELDFVAPFATDNKPAHHRPTGEHLAKLLGASYSSNPAPHSQPVPSRPSGVDHNTQRRLRRGKLPVEAVLDLHGTGQENAKLLLESFIRESHGLQRRVVQVITGKGRLTKGEKAGILRTALPKWLAQPPYDRLVLSFTSAIQSDGGEGAFYILLRRTRT